MKFCIGILTLTFILGCTSVNNLKNDEFIFTIESLNYPFRTEIYDSETNKYSYKIDSEPTQIVNIPFTITEKNSLRKIFPKNSCQYIKSYDDTKKITYRSVHKLVYKSQQEQINCDTVLVNPDLPKMKQFQFFGKFRQILNEKPEYEKAFPIEIY